MLDFDSVQYALEKLGSTSDASESQGTLCGLLLDNAGMAVWMKHTLDELPESGDALAVEHLGVLKTLFEQTRELLNADDMAFELLLPDDSDDFSVRLLGLSGWCRGYLYGYGVVAATKAEMLDKQAEECLSDLLEISRLDHNEVQTGEAEAQYAELVEHVRMSVLFLNEAMNPVAPAPTLQ